MSEFRIVCRDCRPEESTIHRNWLEWCRPCAEVTASRHRSNYPGHRVSITVGVSA
jgi:hypothetical protein